MRRRGRAAVALVGAVALAWLGCGIKGPPRPPKPPPPPAEAPAPAPADAGT